MQYVCMIYFHERGKKIYRRRQDSNLRSNFFVRTRTLLLVVNETYPEGNRFLVYRYNHSATAPDLEILLKIMLNNETIMQDSNVCEP
jgi:hypothetical protein